MTKQPDAICGDCRRIVGVQTEAGHVKWRAHRDCLNSGRWLCNAPAALIPGFEPPACPHETRS